MSSYANFDPAMAKRPEKFEMKPLASSPRLCLGLDFGGTTVKGGLVSESGELSRSFARATPTCMGQLHELFGQLFNSLSDAEIAGIGVGCKGITDKEFDALLHSPGDMSFMEGASFREICSHHAAGIPVFADNDAKTALIAEQLWGAAKGLKNVVMLTLGTGVGGAILIDGKIYRGANGVAGQLGHMTVDAAGGICLCGNRGCLETVFSARSIEAAAFAHVHRRTKSSLTSSDLPITCEGVFRAAAANDEVAVWIVERAIEHLAAALAGIVHILDPELVILGGQIVNAGEPLLAPLRQELMKRTRFFLGTEVPIVVSLNLSHAGVLGAAGLAFLQIGLI
jgi:glucokinase